MSQTDQRFSSSEFYDPAEPQTNKNEKEEIKTVSAKKNGFRSSRNT